MHKQNTAKILCPVCAGAKVPYSTLSEEGADSIVGQRTNCPHCGYSLELAQDGAHFKWLQRPYGVRIRTPIVRMENA